MNNHLPDIRTSIYDYFADMDTRPSLQYKVLAQARGEVKMKKKLSVGLILVIVMVLAAVTALATTLTAFYERIIEQESKSGTIQDWPVSDKVLLVQWMVDAGIQLDETQVARLTNEKLTVEQQDKLAMDIILSYFPARDKLLTTIDIIAKEYGEYEQWPLELRAWYTDTLEKYQHNQNNSPFAKNTVPQEGDISEEEAREIANNCLTEVLGLNAQQVNALISNVFFQEETDGEQTHRVWYFNYYSEGSQTLLYYAYIYSDGTVMDCGSNEQPASAASSLNEHFSDLIAYHYDTFFTVEGLAAFAKDLAPQINRAMESGEEIDKWPAYFAQIPYEYPSEAAISAEKAIEIGTQAILDRYGWSTIQLENQYVYTLSYRVYPSEMHEWRLAYRIPQEGKLDAFRQFNAGEIPFCIIVRIDPFSASVIDITEGNDVDKYWFGE